MAQESKTPAPFRTSIGGQALIEGILIPLGATSFDNDFVKPISPALTVEYGTSQDAPYTPQTDEILMILPRLCFIISGSTALVILKAPVR